MTYLTTEQAQQIEEALDELRYANNTDIAKTKYYKALSTIRAARAREQTEQEPVATHICNLWVDPITKEYVVDHCDHPIDELIPAYAAPVQQAEQPVSQEYQDHLVNQSFDWAAMAAKHQFMEGYRIGLAEMREKCAKVVTEHAPTCSPHWVSYVVAIRAIKFEGDTGFRPVSEMVAEQEPMKECRHCGFLCKPNPNESGKWHPLEQAEQEPIGNISLWHNHGHQNHNVEYYGTLPDGLHQLYAAPVHAKDLTDVEILAVARGIGIVFDESDKEQQIDDIQVFARAVIAKDREKNK